MGRPPAPEEAEEAEGEGGEGAEGAEGEATRFTTISLKCFGPSVVRRSY